MLGPVAAYDYWLKVVMHVTLRRYGDYTVILVSLCNHHGFNYPSRLLQPEDVIIGRYLLYEFILLIPSLRRGRLWLLKVHMTRAILYAFSDKTSRGTLSYIVK